jgi:uncharacterized protein YjbI with pentapeptide repeats
MGGSLEEARFPLPDVESGQPPSVFVVGALLRNIDFSGLSFDALYIAGSILDHCRFEAVSIQRVGFGVLQFHRDWRFPIDWSKPLPEDSPRYRETVYTNCTFADSKLPPRNTDFGNSRFDQCVFHDVLRSTVVAPLFTHPAEFIACKFTGRVSCTVFDGTVRSNSIRRLGRTTCEITRNDFSAAELKSVDFRAIDLTAQTMPPEFALPIEASRDL